MFISEPTYDLAEAEVLPLVAREERRVSIDFLEEWFLAEVERCFVLCPFSFIV